MWRGSEYDEVAIYKVILENAAGRATHIIIKVFEKCRPMEAVKVFLYGRSLVSLRWSRIMSFGIQKVTSVNSVQTKIDLLHFLVWERSTT